MLGQYLKSIYQKATRQNLENIYSLVEKKTSAKFLDLGCDDGLLSKKIADLIQTEQIYGVEIVEKRIKMASKNGVKVSNYDLNKPLGFKNNFFDVVHANQVIEHLYNSDNFVSEIHRILRKGGYAIISTENASSWCNIFASLLGWQMFSLTNFSSFKKGIGNPISLHRDEKITLDSWNHVRIYNILGLKEYFEAAGFRVEEIRGAGYFPLPGFLGNIDKTHSHFMTIKVRKI